MAIQQIDGEPGGGRLTAAWLCLVCSFFLGVLLAPALFNGIVWLGRVHPVLESLRNIEFERVASRSVLICSFLGLLPALKFCGLARWRAVGLTGFRVNRDSLGISFLIGILSMAALYGLAWGSGALRPEAGGFESWPIRVLGYAAGAIAVGVIEEILFRGALFGIFRKTMGFWAGAIGCSLIFAVIHFAKPTPEVAVVYGHWYSGFEIMPNMFRMLGPMSEVLPFFGTLFFMGMTLCVLRDMSYGLYAAIGLHAGWVLIIRSGMSFFERERDRLPLLFGTSDALSKSGAACTLALLFFIGSVIWRRTRLRTA